MKIKGSESIVLSIILIFFGILLYMGLEGIINNNALLIILTGFYATSSFLILFVTWHEKQISKRREIIERILIPIKEELIYNIFMLSRYVKETSSPGLPTWKDNIKRRLPHLAYALPKKYMIVLRIS